MNTTNICNECGEELKMSQYASIKKEGESAEKEKENLVCRNYPRCKISEKELD